MKTQREAESIQKCLDKLVIFLNTLAEETHYNFSYPIESCIYDNKTETVHVTYENGEETVINVAIDSVSAAMKDTMKYTFERVYD